MHHKALVTRSSEPYFLDPVKTIVVTFLFIACCSGYIFGQDSPLQVLAKPKPNYTYLASQNGVIGVVKLEVLFRSDGAIGEIKVVKALPFGLTEMAIDAARKIRFEPKKVNGIAQDLLKIVEYRFDVYTNEKDKDIKKKAKIRKWPILEFSEAEKAEIKRLDPKISISLGGDGIASLFRIEPEISESLRSKIDDAVPAIVFEPAVLKGGHRITVTRTLSLQRLKWHVA